MIESARNSLRDAFVSLRNYTLTGHIAHPLNTFPSSGPIGASLSPASMLVPGSITALRHLSSCKQSVRWGSVGSIVWLAASRSGLEGNSQLEYLGAEWP